ncbi:MAG: ATP-binding protein [Candidatus Bathyarchaeia archaeon]|jgi:DNA helicase HerA-like ATPase
MSARKVGYIAGEVETGSFWFVSDLEDFPPRHEYLIIPHVRERSSSGFKDVEVLAQVSRIANYSDILGERLSLQELETIISRYSGNTKVYGEASILGYMSESGEVLMPRSAAIPGQEVFVAPTETLERFFARDVKSGIPIGNLITRDEVRVVIDPNGFRRHVAIIAQTGAGKSYLVGLMLERLLPLGATIIVFDPNSDYVMMRRDSGGNPTKIADDVVIYRPPGISGRRHSDEEIGGSESYTIDFSSLGSEGIQDVAGISSQWTHIIKAIESALQGLQGYYEPRQLIEALTNLSNDDQYPEQRAAGNALSYIKRLQKYPIWGNKDIPITDLIRPMHMSIIDLAGLQRRVSAYIVSKTLEDIWSRAVTGDLDFPIFVVLEEAHNFAPASGGDRAASSAIIERIAAEGRKFGIFLTVITQRPNKINSNVLSQCNSQIIMRLTNPDDMSAVRRSSEGLSEELFQDLPGLNRGEAIIVGELTKVPTMVKVTGRQSGEGGSDIDIVGALERARGKHKFDMHAEEKPDQKDSEYRTKW